MYIRHCLPLMVTLGATILAACGAAPSPKPQSSAASGVPAATAPAATPGSASSKAFIDPVTGELRAPSEAEQKAAASAAGSKDGADRKSTAPVEGKPIGNGVVEFEVGNRGMVDEVACVQKDGSVTTRCPPASQPK